MSMLRTCFDDGSIVSRLSRPFRSSHRLPEEKLTDAVRACVERMEARLLLSVYAITDLGTLGGPYSSANAINDGAQVVGNSQSTSSPNSLAFLYSNGSMAAIPALDGDSDLANGINASGQVVGAAQTNSNTAFHAFRYTPGNLLDLGGLGGDNSYANGINDGGQVVGYSQTAGNKTDNAFIFSNGSMNAIPALGGDNNYANAINDSGQVALHRWFARKPLLVVGLPRLFRAIAESAL